MGRRWGGWGAIWGFTRRFGISGDLEEFLGTLACPLDPCPRGSSRSFFPCDERPLWVFEETLLSVLIFGELFSSVSRGSTASHPESGIRREEEN